MAYTKRAIIDAIVADATCRRFTGDKRDGDAPPITFENFLDEAFRHGAKALRARLSRLSRGELIAELSKGAACIEKQEEDLRETMALAERLRHEELRQRQADIARRPRLQGAILAAARHYRGRNKNAKEAWRAIKQNPYQTGRETVVIEGDKETEMMYVRSLDGKQMRSPIKFAHWRQRYWPAAKPG